jgi:hypothetical protein
MNKNKTMNKLLIIAIFSKKKLAHEGIEPATFALLARRSNQLS